MLQPLLLSCLLLGVTAIWGWTFSVVKEAIAGYAVLSFLAIRFSIAALCLGPACFRRIEQRDFQVGGVIGLILAAAYLFQTFGLVFTTATNSGLITGLFVVFTPLASRALFGVRTHPLLWVAIAMSILGLALLTGLSIDRLTIGDLLTLGASVCLGIHIALLDRFAKRHDATTLAFAQICSATIVFWLFGLSVEPIQWPSGRVWFALLATGVLATAVGFSVQTYVQQRLGATRTAVLLTMEPVFAMFFGYLAGDRLTPMQLAGAALMGGALLLTELKTQIGVGEEGERRSGFGDRDSGKEGERMP